ncbi:hypothetical protein IT412_05690 [Candidatus Peregrinibacteria bacterium]|nr:hypothetical protein [Candidatus Peregrinibacteria bacterium]
MKRNIKKISSSVNVAYSPYRSAFRQAKIAEKESQQMATAKELVRLEINPIVTISGLMVLSLALGALYLWSFNKVATKGYILKKLEISRQAMKEVTDRNNLYLAKAKSLTGVIDSGKIDHMRKPNEVEFVYGESVLASKN